MPAPTALAAWTAHLPALQVVRALIGYLEDGAYRGTRANLAHPPSGGGATPALPDTMDLDPAQTQHPEQDHWIPLEQLARFKRLLPFPPATLLAALQGSPVAQGLFEVSPDGRHLRKRRPFTAAHALGVLSDAHHAHAVCVHGVPRAMGAEGVRAWVVGRLGCGEADVLAVTRSEEEGVAASSSSSMVHVHLSSMAWCVQALTHPAGQRAAGAVDAEDEEAEESEEAWTFGPVPTPRGLEEAAATAHAALPSHDPHYVVGRVLAFRSPALPPSTHPDDLKRAFDAYAAVSWVDLPPRSGCEGHIVFRQGVVSTVLQVLARCGGLELHGEPVSCRWVVGEEECMYWRVHAHREASMPTEARERRRAVTEALNAHKSLLSRRRKPGAKSAATKKVAAKAARPTLAPAKGAAAGRVQKRAAAPLRKRAAAGGSTSETPRPGSTGTSSSGSKRVRVDPLRDLLHDMFLEQGKSSS